MAKRTVTEWRVTGDPTCVINGKVLNFPPYYFVWYSDQWYDERGRPTNFGDRELTAKQAAKRFMRISDRWKEGPFLHKRKVTYTDWKEADGS